MVTEPTPRFELISEEDVPRISATAADGASAAAAAKPSHAKKRDAGHIPRPPNAFILFRSSFIKSESVPGNIEGNHSTLSKIIGIVWKTLPPAERQLWEKRAVQAQAEHRARYPDWRFRP
ncbi:high mobility group box domain-containing protein, partial [Russula vinacea]